MKKVRNGWEHYGILIARTTLDHIDVTRKIYTFKNYWLVGGTLQPFKVGGGIFNSLAAAKDHITCAYRDRRL